MGSRDRCSVSLFGNIMQCLRSVVCNLRMNATRYIYEQKPHSLLPIPHSLKQNKELIYDK